MTRVWLALGSNLTFTTASADPNKSPLPNQIGGTQVYFNGIPAPIVYAAPDRVTAQIPWELSDTTSINAYVRSESPDGTVRVSTPVAVTIVPAMISERGRAIRTSAAHSSELTRRPSV